MRLSVVTLGHVHAEDLVALTKHFEHIEQLVLDVAPRDPLDAHRAELNRAIDAATADWILILREREVIDDPLALEIVRAAGAGTAWGFRIRAIPWYAGKPLRIGRDDGELRLVHRRHLLRRGELAVQGTVVRLESMLRSVTFASADEHRRHLAEKARAQSALRRAMTFARYALGTRAFDANTLRYLWIEAGYAS
ncbi:MAG TPA: hypothetical protein VJZ00_19000 [Thermoanaerobaculia bacterium]|nr:hypothetical protein [Thermoanaerobaculia bacterium]